MIWVTISLAFKEEIEKTDLLALLKGLKKTLKLLTGNIFEFTGLLNMEIFKHFYNVYWPFALWNGPIHPVRLASFTSFCITANKPTKKQNKQMFILKPNEILSIFMKFSYKDNTGSDFLQGHLLV